MRDRDVRLFNDWMIHNICTSPIKFGSWWTDTTPKEILEALGNIELPEPVTLKRILQKWNSMPQYDPFNPPGDYRFSVTCVTPVGLEKKHLMVTNYKGVFEMTKDELQQALVEKQDEVTKLQARLKGAHSANQARDEEHNTACRENARLDEELLELAEKNGILEEENGTLARQLCEMQDVTKTALDVADSKANVLQLKVTKMNNDFAEHRRNFDKQTMRAEMAEAQAQGYLGALNRAKLDTDTWRKKYESKAQRLVTLRNASDLLLKEHKDLECKCESLRAARDANLLAVDRFRDERDKYLCDLKKANNEIWSLKNECTNRKEHEDSWAAKYKLMNQELEDVKLMSTATIDELANCCEKLQHSKAQSLDLHARIARIKINHKRHIDALETKLETVLKTSCVVDADREHFARAISRAVCFTSGIPTGHPSISFNDFRDVRNRIPTHPDCSKCVYTESLTEQCKHAREECANWIKKYELLKTERTTPEFMLSRVTELTRENRKLRNELETKCEPCVKLHEANTQTESYKALTELQNSDITNLKNEVDRLTTNPTQLDYPPCGDACNLVAHLREMNTGKNEQIETLESNLSEMTGARDRLVKSVEGAPCCGMGSCPFKDEGVESVKIEYQTNMSHFIHRFRP